MKLFHITAFAIATIIGIGSVGTASAYTPGQFYRAKQADCRMLGHKQAGAYAGYKTADKNGNRLGSAIEATVYLAHQKTRVEKGC